MRHRVLRCLVLSMVGLSPAGVSAAVQVGVASPMVKVMIEGGQPDKNWPFEGTLGATSYSLALARNEHEAFQVVIFPDQALTNAQVTLSTLQPAGAQGAFNGTAGVWLVGHVKAAAQPISDLNIQYPSYLVNYKGGWWPDALLTFKNSCAINARDRVAFWIDMATRADTPPGDYTATVTVAATGIAPITLALHVRVWDFALPAKPSLPTAFSIDSIWQASWVYGNSWSDAIRDKYLAMQRDHRLNVAEIYRNSPRGTSWFAPWMPTNNAFCLTMVPNGIGTELTNLYAWFAGQGRLGEAYVYGYDEVGSSEFPEMGATFSQVHASYPGLRTMTTANDPTFGTGENSSYLRPVVDIWVPETRRYSKSAAAALRAEGKDMWWYVCMSPRHPYANWLLEYPAIEARLLPGFMTHKSQAGGMLYYAVTNYGYDLVPDYMPKNTIIETGPYTTWDARVLQSGGFVSGDGCLYYPGPVNVGPLPSLRVANIRDGLEDYEYLCKLGELVSIIEGYCVIDAEQQAWLASARALLTVPDSISTSASSFTRDTALVYEYRRQLAEAIVQGAGYAARLRPDTDGDGVADECDNCPNTSDPAQHDVDSDGVGDACDTCPGSPAGGYVTLQGCPTSRADFDRDGDVDQSDFGHLQACLSGAHIPQIEPACHNARLNDNLDVDQLDVQEFLACMRGTGIPSDANCPP